MKVLFRYARQPRPYADSYGEMLVKLEENETKEDALIKYNGSKDDGWHSNSFKEELSEYVEVKYDGNKNVIKGRLLLFKTHDRYTG